VNVSQVVLGFASVASAAIISTAKQLGWETKAQKHGEYASHYGELARLINSERTLALLNDSSFASAGDLIKKVQAELDKIEENAPPVPGFIEKRIGASESLGSAIAGSQPGGTRGFAPANTAYVEMRQSSSPVGAGRAAGDSVARYLRDIAEKQATERAAYSDGAPRPLDSGSPASSEGSPADAGVSVAISGDQAKIRAVAEENGIAQVPNGPEGV
jgi:hypothetical protein